MTTTTTTETPILRQYPLHDASVVHGSKYGEYLTFAAKSRTGKLLRLFSMDELQAEWVLTNELRDYERDNMDAHALAWNFFSRTKPDPESAERHSLRHKEAAEKMGKAEAHITRIQAEFQYRMENPLFDPEDPFREE